ncbi:hypothetical protein E4U09_003167 [Claviceps aff. purpurea]|uniref:Uncharacterized protein n=1 Tax=Claviceps aff. purpurea TaxID=1967640 RepID=A0A9P7QES9_9HYPO|nr:hypothetical protein E4U09_003167 [Claviceps aff. purpurea]
MAETVESDTYEDSCARSHFALEVKNLGLVSDPEVRFLQGVVGALVRASNGSVLRIYRIRRPSNWTPDGRILLEYDVLQALALISDGSVGLVYDVHETGS